MQGVVSIIIPVYNVEKYLDICVKSILSQSYKALEVILIDDGSTDSSGKICDYYADFDQRVRVIHQLNQGAAAAKNIGLDNATGEFITFVDSDDWVNYDWLETMLWYLRKNNADIVECGFYKNYLEEEECKGIDSNVQGEYTAEKYLYNYLTDWTCSLFWNKLFKADTMDNIRFRKERRCIDDEFFTYKAISNARTIIRIKECLYHYRQRKNSAVYSKKNSIQKGKDALEILVERYEWITSKYPRLKSVYLKHDIEILFFIAQSFIFDEETIQIFHNNVRYYSRKVFTELLFEIQYFKYILKLNLMKEPYLLAKKKRVFVEQNDKELFS